MPALDQPLPVTTRLTAHCTNCGTSETITDAGDHNEALDILDTLGWTDLDHAPLCPNCASWEATP